MINGWQGKWHCGTALFFVQSAGVFCVIGRLNFSSWECNVKESWSVHRNGIREKLLQSQLVYQARKKRFLTFKRRRKGVERETLVVCPTLRLLPTPFSAHQEHREPCPRSTASFNTTIPNSPKTECDGRTQSAIICRFRNVFSGVKLLTTRVVVTGGFIPNSCPILVEGILQDARQLRLHRL